MLRKIILSLLALYNGASAYQCNDIYCIEAKLGIGLYYSFFSTPTRDLNNIGAYIPLDTRYYAARLSLAIEGAFGIGNNKNFLIITTPNIGLNLGSFKYPLVISFSMPIEAYITNANSEKFIMSTLFLGGNIYHRYMLDDKIGIEYSAGYAYSVLRGYELSRIDITSTNNNSHRIEASFSMIYYTNRQFQRGNKAYLYAKLKGIYYINKAFEITNGIQYPANNNFTIMLETGISLY
ncbi:hypothetical protein LS73_001285 [Helicobacter muridarum]|uniref:Uncharacterized protein n=1 Tax=Helicobacter muridarum TaxID=216 RepID=A0A099TVS5_9HELI|nr:hypothetical protein [Helicobacter muridarum]TLE01347.1 hypothetical protein LS73_001285 [Helicobacter muridarum]STQ85268.1 Uncharacterised protein [Helicobacter muridarum]